MTRKLQPDQPDLIIAFDLSLESFSEMPLPETGYGDGDDDGEFEIEVALFEGCLCMIVNYHSTRVDVWVMKEYGLKESWCKLFSLMESPDLRSLKCLRPLGYSVDGVKILLEHNRKKLCWYDLRSKQVSHVRIPGMPNLNEGMICVGSLVPPSLPVENCRRQRKLGCENARKTRYLRDYYLGLPAFFHV